MYDVALGTAGAAIEARDMDALQFGLPEPEAVVDGGADVAQCHPVAIRADDRG